MILMREARSEKDEITQKRNPLIRLRNPKRILQTLVNLYLNMYRKPEKWSKYKKK